MHTSQLQAAACFTRAAAEPTRRYHALLHKTFTNHDKQNLKACAPKVAVMQEPSQSRNRTWNDRILSVPRVQIVQTCSFSTGATLPRVLAHIDACKSVKLGTNRQQPAGRRCVPRLHIACMSSTTGTRRVVAQRPGTRTTMNIGTKALEQNFCEAKWRTGGRPG